MMSTAKKTKGSRTASGEAYDVEAARAKSVAQYSKFIEEVDRTEELGSGTWLGMPHAMKKWHFVRFNKQHPEHLEMAHLLKQKGYVDAPPGVKCVGFERDYDKGLYLCCPPELWASLRERRIRAKMARTQTLQQTFGGHIPDNVELTKERVGG